MIMRSWLRSVRAKMLVMTALAVLPGFVIASLNAFAMMSQAESNARLVLTHTITAVQNTLSDVITDGLSDISLIRSSPGMTGQACPELMRHMAAQRPTYLQMGMAGSDGRQICTVKPHSGNVALIDPALVQRALRTPGHPVVSLAAAHPDTVPEALVVVASSTTDPGHSVIFLIIALDDVFHAAQDPVLQLDQLLVADAAGHVTSFGGTSRTKSAAVLISSINRLEESRGLPASHEPRIERIGGDLMGWATLAETGARFILRIDRDNLYHAARKTIERQLAMLLAGMLGVLGMVWWTGRRLILHPADALSRMADRLAQGDLDARTGLPRGADELAKVADALDRMAAEIQQRDAERNRHLRELGRNNRFHSILAAVNAAIVRRTSVKVLLDDICRITCDIGDFRLAWIGEVDAVAKFLRPVAWSGRQSALLANLTFPLDADVPEGRGPAATAAREGVVVVCQSFLEDPATTAWQQLGQEVGGVRSAAAFPLGFSSQGERRILALYSGEDEYFAAEDLRLLEQLAQDATFGLHMIAVEQSLAHAHTHDLITGLPNESLLVERLRDVLHRAKAEHKIVSVCVLDIGLPSIVSQWGSQPGNTMLKEIGLELEAHLDGEGIVGVLPGSRFAIAINDLDCMDTTLRHMDELLKRLCAVRVCMQDESFGVTPRMGVAVFPEDGLDPCGLLDKAQEVLASIHPGEPVRFFAPGLSMALQENRRLEKQLQGATANGELALHYQPIIELASGRLKGFEALLRWSHPALGLVPPDRFIPLAESSGLIEVIGEWVVKEAARQAFAWERRGVENIFISLNVSAVQLRNPKFAERIATALKALGGFPKKVRLALELTESQLMIDIDASIGLLGGLRCLGISVILDDFGTGYSSLSYLHRLPVDVLKIDKSFIASIDSSNQAHMVVRGILALARSLKIATVAEGIERAEQLDMVTRMGCTYAQGFWFDPALPSIEVERKWL
ncbi:MAG: EAL domain-containing protein [Rhodanobacter sp.]|nr:MAG: EAL domain-containing protein [Rhodanobacter sp.]